MPDSAPYPLGLYDHPPDPSFTAIKGYKLPEFPGAGTLRAATRVLNDANRFLDNLSPLP